MRKFISIFLLTILILLSLQFVAAGDNQHNLRIQQSTEESIVETADGLNNLEGNAKSSDLFWATLLKLEKTSDGQLIITGYTEGTGEVTKCGFTYIKLQRLVGGSWTDYTEYCYYDLYSNSSSKYFKVYVSPPKGYSYRATCEHYAEKPLLGILKSKQKIINTTTTINF